MKKGKKIRDKQIKIVLVGIFLIFLCSSTIMPLFLLKDNNTITSTTQEQYLPKLQDEDNLLHFYDFEDNIIGEDPFGTTLSVKEDPADGSVEVANRGDDQQNHVLIHKTSYGIDARRLWIRDNVSYYGDTFQAGEIHFRIYKHDIAGLEIAIVTSNRERAIYMVWAGNANTGIIWNRDFVENITNYPYNQWLDVVIYFNLRFSGWMFDLNGIRYGAGYTLEYDNPITSNVSDVTWSSFATGSMPIEGGRIRIDDIAFYFTKYTHIFIDDSDPDNNWAHAFNEGWCYGSGTWSNPYIIENFIIDAEGTGSGILIKNSYNHFIIKNCFISNVGHAAIKLVNVHKGKLLNNTCSGGGGYAGILLNKSADNMVYENIANNQNSGILLLESNDTIISKNTANFNGYRGIGLEHCNNITIIKNIINGAGRGILLDKSHYNNITYNQLFEIYSSCIRLSQSHNNTISENIICTNDYYDGIQLLSSYNNLILRNNVNDTGSGIRVDGDNNIILENILTNNRGYGIFIEGSYNKVILNNISDCGSGSYYTGGILIRFEGNTISNNTILNYDGNGICLQVGDYNIISNNDIITSKNGIWLEYSENNDFYENLINNSSENGVILIESDNNTIQANDIINNEMSGIAIDDSSDWNLIYNNKFLGNGLSAVDNGTNNRWDNGLIGNYWDDYGNFDEDYDGIGDTPYNVSGTSGSKDYFPLGFFAPYIIINLPFENQEFRELAPAFHIFVDETYLISTWYTLDNGVTTTNFTGLFGYIDQDIWDSIPNGLVTITFYVKDIFDNEWSEEVNIIKNVPVIVKFIQVEITDNFYSLEHFNLTFFVFDEIGQGIDSATTQMWWNGNDVSTDVQNLGNGLYFVSLEPITIAPGEDPILLIMVISAAGYEDKYFETYIGVDPEVLEKGNTPPGSDVEVIDEITGVNITFSEVTSGGMTTIEKSEEEPDPPSGFEVAGDYYAITTDASYSGFISLAIPYNETKVQGNEENLRLFHWDPSTGWTDVTTGIDTVNNIIYGEFTRLSIFVVMEEFKYIFEGYGALRIEGKWYRSESKLFISDDLIKIEIGDQSASWEITTHYVWRNIEYYRGSGSQGKIYIIIHRGKDLLKAFALGDGVLFYGTSMLDLPVSLNLNSLNLNDSRYIIYFISILMGLVGLIYRKKQVIHFKI